VDQGVYDSKITGKEPLKLYTREQVAELQATLKRIEEEKVKAAEQAKAVADAEKAAAAGEAVPAEAKEEEAPKKEAKKEPAKKEAPKKEAAKK
jgi:colicin import membrane protein